VLKISNLSFNYKSKKVLKNLSFSLRPNQITALLGKNGAGKSTLINIIAGLLKFNEGEISFNDFSLPKEYIAASKNIGMMFQEITLPRYTKVKDILADHALLYDVKHSQGWIDELITKLDLVDKLGTETQDLSGGMQRRLMVALTLVHKPKLIILDEPTAGVDIAMRDALWELLHGLKSQGHTILITTHNMQEVESLCDEIAFIHNGEILLHDTTEKVIKKNNSFKELFFKTDRELSSGATVANSIRISKEWYQLEIKNIDKINHK
jgi:ABC-2 type transport system ATP-binding protein